MDEKLAAEYGKCTVRQLQILLAARNLKKSGKKAELITRLIFYEKNHNAEDESDDNQHKERIGTPPKTSYKDLHAGCPRPKFTKDDLRRFLQRYQKKRRESDKMYQEGYLVSIRFSEIGNVYYLQGRCDASMKKSVQYEVDARLSMQGDIEGTSCECAAGWSIEAHCKHVIILLLGLLDMCENETVTLGETCTSQLQTFHRPSKKYNKSPQQAKLLMRRKVVPIRLTYDDDEPASPPNPDPKFLADHEVFAMTEEYKQKFIERFRNLVINSGHNMSMSIRMIIPPANIHGVVWDHMYSELNLARELLRGLQLIEITNDDVLAIEEDTRGQAHNYLWHWHRKHRMSCSLFSRVCHVTPAGAANLVRDIMDPQPIYNAAIEHGRKYEGTAVKAWNDCHCGYLNLVECGLFVHPEHPEICGTPDRLNAVLSVLEIKCPYKARYDYIDDTTVPSLIPYLQKDIHGNWALKKNSPYYYQVQGQLLVTGRLFCDFAVWTFKDMVRVSIERDEKFIDYMLKKLKEFNKLYLQPAILCKYLFKNSEKFVPKERF
ncbi:hypothetical protein QAD02_014745 [Eretmocerus hayati]|uniref:Uncharacterized protein n=1 Tax=Eretmocerus hayati TaxID=131215 RepID=A0ACC2P787_9HYME|nr:hypothetical protein QAD02_014745 [Eretmocerus hayati]